MLCYHAHLRKILVSFRGISVNLRRSSPPYNRFTPFPGKRSYCTVRNEVLVTPTTVCKQLISVQETLNCDFESAKLEPDFVCLFN